MGCQFVSSDFCTVVLQNISSVIHMGSLGNYNEDVSSSDDDEEHNINNTFLLLIADARIAPMVLAGLSDVEEILIALGCRFALDLLSIAQHNWTDGPPPACPCCVSTP